MSTWVRNPKTDRLIEQVVDRLNGDQAVAATADHGAETVAGLLREYLDDGAYYCISCLGNGVSYCDVGAHTAGSWYVPHDAVFGPTETLRLIHGYAWAAQSAYGAEHAPAMRYADEFVNGLADIFALNGVDVDEEMATPPSGAVTRAEGIPL